MQINLNDIYRETLEALREAELRAAELRGQIKLIERLINDAQAVTTEGEET